MSRLSGRAAPTRPAKMALWMVRLWWAQCKRAACQRKNAADPDLNALIHEEARFRSLLDGSTV